MTESSWNYVFDLDFDAEFWPFLMGFCITVQSYVHEKNNALENDYDYDCDFLRVCQISPKCFSRAILLYMLFPLNCLRVCQEMIQRRRSKLDSRKVNKMPPAFRGILINPLSHESRATSIRARVFCQLS